MPALACEVAASAFLLPLGNAAYVLDDDCVQDSVQGDLVAMKNSHQIWSPNHSADLYKIGGWGAPYFSVNSAGNISVRPHGESTMPYSEIDLMKVVKKVTEFKSDNGLGLQLPVIIRFPDVLRDRLDSLQAAFDSAILDSEYESHYQGVYPVKCNQDQKIVEDIVDFGRQYRFGLEAGSKPELLLAMSALCKGNPDSFLICNGYKDREYISLALLARKLELKTVIVLEQEEELDLVLEVSKKLGVRPVIGLRAKLRTKHSGHFGSTSGEKGKFGLTTIQVLSVVNKLKRSGMLDCLQLLHFHIGSQIPSVDLLGDGVGEAAQIYCELVRLGAGMKIIDIGGGLGIDYDGTNSPSSDMSVGYSLNEYASAVVRTVGDVCRKKFVKHPILCSESGRALVSHHSVLIFEAVPSVPTSTGDFFGSQGFDFASLIDALSDEGRAYYRNLAEAAGDGEFGLCLTYVERLKQRCVDEFKEGSLGMVELAAVDSLCEFVSKAVADHGGNSGDDKVNSYHVNLSIFTSIPDFWAIGQLFPIVPIHRLDERPTVKAVLSDLTCDSDGKVNKFIGGGDSLPLHEIRQGDRYCLGMFLGGAYQEALGGLHNLFGNPSVVRVVQSDGPHCFAITGAVPGQSCADVLQAMQHEPAMMFQSLMSRADECLRASMGKSAAPMPEDGEVTDENKAVESIAYSFHSTPYLIGDLAGKWDCHSG